MLLQKWNFKTHEYELFDSPAKKVTLYSENMNERVDCANCGKQINYGDTYTSRTIHTRIGFGYPVCGVCYETEFEDERKSASV